MDATMNENDRAEAFKLDADGIVWLTSEQSQEVENQRAAAIEANRKKLETLKAAREQATYVGR